MLTNLNINVTGAEFKAVQNKEQTCIYKDVNNTNAKLLCQKYSDNKCTNTNCDACIKANGFSYVCYPAVTIATGRKNLKTKQFKIKHICREVQGDDGNLMFCIKLGEEV